MPIESATTERSFSVLRRLKTYVRSTIKNDMLSSLNWCIFTEFLKWTVDLYKAIKVLVSAKTQRADFEQF